MLLALLSLAAEEAEPSKTAFYVGGGLLAGWAVVLGALGMTQPDFPSNEGVARGVMGISVALTLVAIITMLVTA
jgi:hypothetical protein